MTTETSGVQTQAASGYYFDDKRSKNFDYFFLGFIIYTVASVYSTVDPQNYVVAIPLQSAGIITMLFCAARLIKFNISNGYLRVVFIAYFGWILVIIARGFPFSYQSGKDLLFDAEHGVMMYLLPLTLLFPQNIFFYKKLFGVVVILAAFFLTFDLLFIKQVLDVTNYYSDVSDAKYIYEHFVKSLSITIGFLILSYKYQSGRVRWFSLLVAAIAIYFSLIRARRGLLFMSICPLVIGSFIYAVAEKRRWLVAIFYVICITVFFTTGLKKSAADSGPLKLLQQRVDADTRSPVEDCLYRDMKPIDWAIGRGISGRYYCPDIDQIDRTGYRDIIETDYLNIILKGGIVTLALLLLIMLPAIIRGLFFSKNLLSKAAAIWIFLWVVDLYPASVHAFTLNYLLVWISVGICYNRAILKMPEKVIQAYFLSINDIARKMPAE